MIPVLNKAFKEIKDKETPRSQRSGGGRTPGTDRSHRSHRERPSARSGMGHHSSRGTDKQAHRNTGSLPSRSREEHTLKTPGQSNQPPPAT